MFSEPKPTLTQNKTNKPERPPVSLSSENQFHPTDTLLTACFSLQNIDLDFDISNGDLKTGYILKLHSYVHRKIEVQS